MTCGIYRLEFPNGKFYYGSAIDVDRRLAQHKKDLRAGKHCNPQMQFTFNKYGSFEFEQIVTCAPHTRLLWEQSYLDEFVGNCECLNVNTKASGGGANKGRRFPNRKKAGPMSPEHKAKIAAAMKGKPKTAAAAAKTAAAKVGKPRDAETKAKLSAALTGKVQSDETKAKRAASLAAARAAKKAAGLPWKRGDN